MKQVIMRIAILVLDEALSILGIQLDLKSETLSRPFPAAIQIFKFYLFVCFFQMRQNTEHI